jgi:hypothetical protein
MVVVKLQWIKSFKLNSTQRNSFCFVHLVLDLFPSVLLSPRPRKRRKITWLSKAARGSLLFDSKYKVFCGPRPSIDRLRASVRPTKSLMHKCFIGGNADIGRERKKERKMPFPPRGPT